MQSTDYLCPGVLHAVPAKDGLLIRIRTPGGLISGVQLKAVAHAAPILQLFVCIPVGIGTGVALTLLFPRPRQSAFFVGSKIKHALKARFATS